MLAFHESSDSGQDPKRVTSTDVVYGDLRGLLVGCGRWFVVPPQGGRLGIRQGVAERGNHQVAMLLGEDQRWPDLEDIGIRSRRPNEYPVTA